MAKDVHPVPDTFEMVTIIYNKIVAGLLTSKDEDLLFNGIVDRMGLGVLQLVQKRIANEIAAKTAPVTETAPVAETAPAAETAPVAKKAKKAKPAPVSDTVTA